MGRSWQQGRLMVLCIYEREGETACLSAMGSIQRKCQVRLQTDELSQCTKEEMPRKRSQSCKKEQKKCKRRKNHRRNKRRRRIGTAMIGGDAFRNGLGRVCGELVARQ